MKVYSLLALSVLVFSSAFFLSPGITSAQTDSQQGGSGTFIPCSGTSCSACDLVALANSIIDWLIGFLAIVFVVIFIVAGIRLVISGGNPGAKEAAKSALTNALIGFIIVLGAWLLIDTLMRALVGDDGNLGSTPWSQIECMAQEVPGNTQYSIDVLSVSRGNVAGVERTYSCTESEGVWDCSASTQRCEAENGRAIERTTSDGRKYIECAYSATNYGSCEPVVNASNPCHADNLEPYFGSQAETASIICNKESGGAPIRSRSDICCGTNGCGNNEPSFSGGYFQINILVHADKIPGCTPGAFYRRNGTAGPQGDCVQRNREGICTGWSCEITDREMYGRCLEATYKRDLNLRIAQQLFEGRGNRFGDWSWSARRCNIPY